MQPIPGIHHITAFAQDPQTNVDFYQQVLGQRLVKTTVNFDDPGTYHFYYGDEVGTPGTILTFFPWPMVAPGKPGNGEVAAVAYTIRPESLAFWRTHLAGHNLTVTEETRLGTTVLTFADPDGMGLELVADAAAATIHPWQNGPIPAEHALRGFHSATLWVAQAEPTLKLLTGPMGYEQVAQEGNRYRVKAAGEAQAIYLDLLERPGLGRGRVGAGSVHHIAFRTDSDESQLSYQQTLSQAGMRVTPVQDRQYLFPRTQRHSF
jgi:glyoxalase family protein